MSAATEQQNNGDVAVEKVAADAVKEDLKSQKPVVDDGKPLAADNGTASKDGEDDDDDEASSPAKEVKGTKRHAETKNSETKKAKKDKAAEGDSDEEEIIEEEGNESDIESDEYDIPYDGEEDDIECEDDDDENDSGSEGDA